MIKKYKRVNIHNEIQKAVYTQQNSKGSIIAYINL